MLDEQGLNLTVPENVEAQQVKESKILVVTVTQDGQYIVNETSVPVNELGSVIKGNIEQYPDGLMIQSDGDATHGAVVKLMDEARNAGVKNISIGQI